MQWENLSILQEECAFLWNWFSRWLLGVGYVCLNSLGSIGQGWTKGHVLDLGINAVCCIREPWIVLLCLATCFDVHLLVCFQPRSLLTACSLKFQSNRCSIPASQSLPNNCWGLPVFVWSCPFQMPSFCSDVVFMQNSPPFGMLHFS